MREFSCIVDGKFALCLIIDDWHIHLDLHGLNKEIKKPNEPCTSGH